MTKELKNPKTFIIYLQTIHDVFENWENYKKRKVLIVLDDMMAEMVTDKTLNPIVTKPFLRGRKLIVSLVFIL